MGWESGWYWGWMFFGALMPGCLLGPRDEAILA
jgi:hypothetical protein